MFKKRKPTRFCYVPNCRSGYKTKKNSTEKCSLFAAPKDDVMRLKWAKIINRTDRPLDVNRSICEKHFEEKFIVRDFVHIVKGEEVRIPRERPMLTKDAYPTIFSDSTKYVSSSVKPKKKRKSPIKKPRNESKKLSNIENHVIEDNQDIEAEVKLEDFNSANLPKYWSKICFKNSPDVIGFAQWNSDDGAFQLGQPNKYVLLKDSDGVLFYSAIINGVNVISKTQVNSVTTLENFLRDFDASSECPGAGEEKEFAQLFLNPGNKITNYKVFLNIYRSDKCTGISTNERRCFYCKNLRNVLLDKAVRLKVNVKCN